MIKDPRLGRLTQGSIFCGGTAEDYTNEPVWGVIITARCDTTHEKVPVLNYLPIIRVADWLHVHGAQIILDRAHNALMEKFKSYLKQRELSESLIDVYDVRKIVQVHFTPPADPTVSKKAEREAKIAQESFELAEHISRVQQCLGSESPSRGEISALLCKNPKHVNSVVADLISHKLAGYYFLPDLGTNTEKPSDCGYVVVLREVRHLSRTIVSQLIKGIEFPQSANFQGLSFKSFDFACPVAEISSPWIEHLLQCFCNLFGRIGIKDIDRVHVNKITKSALPLMDELK